MKAWTTLAVLAATLLVLTTVGCAAGNESTTTGASAPTSPTTTEATTTTMAPPETGTTPLTAEDYEIYSAVIQSMFIDATHPAIVVIEESTTRANVGLFSLSDAVGAIEDQWPDLGDEALADFEATNQDSSALERGFTLSVDYSLISEQEIESIFSAAGGWDDFYAKYPDSQGIFTLSRVGFNEAKDAAALYVANRMHGVGGGGQVVLMKKTADGWAVQGSRRLWIS